MPVSVYDNASLVAYSVKVHMRTRSTRTSDVSIGDTHKIVGFSYFFLFHYMIPIQYVCICVRHFCFYVCLLQGGFFVSIFS